MPDVEELKITFKAIDEYAYNVCLAPSPAKEYIPEWWKKMEAYTSDNLMSDKTKQNKYAHVTSKKCFPMLDAITGGYIIPLWADVEVTTRNDALLCPVLTANDIEEIVPARLTIDPPVQVPVKVADDGAVLI